MGDGQRRRSWPWRKLKSSNNASSAKAGPDCKSARSTASQLVSPASSFKANESERFLETLSREASTSAFAVEEGRVLEANAVREQAEESLQALKQELSIVMREMIAKEALVNQHKKLADEAVAGWEKAEKDALSFQQDLESAAKQRSILEDRIVQLDGALKECMRQVRHVRDEQEGKVQDAITCKTREWEEVKADMEVKQAELQTRLMEFDAQNGAMTKSLQERARKILEANEVKSRAETELKVVQVKLGSAEKDISALQYELHLLSKELEIRTEEVSFCKKSADIAHKQHLDTVMKLAKLEADCYRLRTLLKKKLPGPAAIAQMRKEVEGLPPTARESISATSESKRRPNKSYASSTISFTNSHQRVGAGAGAGAAFSINRDVEALRDRLSSMEEENKLLKEALSKRIGELQASWLLCAKTASKLSVAEDQLESLQGTPRAEKIMNGSESFHFTATTEPSIASVTADDNGFSGDEYDIKEASCAESWASALVGELAQFKREKIVTKEVTESSYTTKESPCTLEKGSVTHAKEMVVDKKEHPAKMLSPEPEQPAHLKMRNPFVCDQDGHLQALNLLCKDLDRKLGAIEKHLHIGGEVERAESSDNAENLVTQSVISLVDAAHQKFSELGKAIQGMQRSMSVPAIPDHAASAASTITDLISDSRPDVHTEVPTSNILPIQESIGPMHLQPNSDHTTYTSNCEEPTVLKGTADIVPVFEAVVAERELQLPSPETMVLMEASSMITPAENEVRLNAMIISREDQKCNLITETEHDQLGSLSFVLCKLVTLLEMLPAGSATSDADSAGEDQPIREQEKQGLISCKDRFLVGQASVLELLVRVGLILCRACRAGDSELEDVLASLKKAEYTAVVHEVGLQVEVEAAGALRQRQRQEASCKVQASELEVEPEVASELVEPEVAGEECGEEARLRAEAVLYKELHRELEAKCEEQERKLQGFLQLEKDRTTVNLSHPHESTEDMTKLTKANELVEAKEKLAECERTMVVLGKQLHSLSSSKDPPSPSPPAQYQLHTFPRHHYLPDLAHQLRSSIDDAFVAADVDPLPRPRAPKQPPFHVVSGPQHPHHYQHFFQRSCGPVHVAHSQHVKGRRQRHVELEATSWAQQQQQEEEEYSPPMSAMSSPAKSPARYVQQAAGGRRRRASAVRMRSLMESLNDASASSAPPRKPVSAPGGNSSFGKLFSRSTGKNHR